MYKYVYTYVYEGMHKYTLDSDGTNQSDWIQEIIWYQIELSNFLNRIRLKLSKIPFAKNQ